jgi:MoxR-like ATPase
MTEIGRIALPEPPDGTTEVNFAVDSGLDRVHLLRAKEIYAVNAAIAASRPLLVRGEPGIGKSQLARAAAKKLGRAFVTHVVDSHTESRDLMWTFDAVSRLAEAQLAGSLRQDLADARRELAIENYLHPGPLWWAFDWAGAERQRISAKGRAPSQPDGGDWRKGCVLLLDEIDKAESEVPNGLLEALGAREFTPFGCSEPVRASGHPPLVLITTNEERALPDAFLRRCLVLHLRLPEDETQLIDFLAERGRAHFRQEIDETVLRAAAKMLFDDRQNAIRNQITPLPGQAEYLDLLRATLGLAEKTPVSQQAMLEIVAEYTIKKHVGLGAAD